MKHDGVTISTTNFFKGKTTKILYLKKSGLSSEKIMPQKTNTAGYRPNE
jgi:hypothetical protein